MPTLEELQQLRERDYRIARRLGLQCDNCGEIGACGCLEVEIGSGVPHFTTEDAAALTLFRHHALTCQMIGYTVQDPRRRPDLTDVTELGYAFEWFCTARGEAVHGPTLALAICNAWEQEMDRRS